MTSLRCYVRFNNQRAPFLTDVKIEPRYFNIEKQRADENSRFNGAEINKRLEEILSFIKTKFDNYYTFPDPKKFAELCEEFILTGEPVEQKEEPIQQYPKTLLRYLVKIYEDSVSGKRTIPSGPRKGQRYRYDTLKSYKSCIGVIEAFMKNERVDDLPLEKLDSEFYEKLSHFYYNELKLGVSYFSVVIKIIKMILHDAHDRFENPKYITLAKKLVKPTYESDTVYLNTKQLKQFWEHQYNQERENYLENARDLFLVGCWTGLRYSDFSSLKDDDVKQDYIRVKMEKTSGRVAIPLHPMLKKIIAKYNGGLPRPISNQKLNNYIKTAAKKAGLDHEITVRKNVGGVDVEETKRFYELISSHTARRSFATNMFKKGIPTLLIMAITGHKTEAAFLKYIRVSNEEKAQMMAEIWKKIDWD